MVINVKKLLTAVLISASVIASISASADEFIFGFSESFWVKFTPSTQRLDLTLDNGASLSFDTQQSEFTPGFKNQGWWSDHSDPHFSDSPNYFAGWYTLGTVIDHHNFFSFDLSALPAGAKVTNAVLDLSTFNVSSGSGRTYQPYSLWDVSTDPRSLSLDQGVNPAIFDDLGSGINYGNFLVPVNNASPFDRVQTTMNFQLNSSALSDIQNHAGGFFSIGGSGPASVQAVPEPGALTFFGALSAMSAGFWLVRTQRRRTTARSRTRSSQSAAPSTSPESSRVS